MTVSSLTTARNRTPGAARGTRLVSTLTLATMLLGAVGLSTTAAATASPATAPSKAPSKAGRTEPPNTDGWWYRVMGLAKVHREVTGKGVTIALIDSNLDPAFPDLKGAHIVMKDRCLEDQRSTPRSGLYGWHGDSMASFLVGTGHGNGPGGAGARGVAPDATLLFYQTDTLPERPPEQPHDECDGVGLAELIDKAVDDGADIVSISLTAGGKYLRLAAKRAMRRGVVVVAASGDATDPSLYPEEVEFAFGAPAGYRGVVAVYAADSKARPWVGNPIPRVRFGDHAYPTITAPGVDIRTPYYKPGAGWSSVGKTATGTSPATAIVAGSLALVKSKYPRATANQLIQSLIHDTGGSAKYGYDPKYGYGIVSVPSMLAHDPTKWPDVNPLLHGPKAAVRDFPASSYGRAASTGSEDQATRSKPAPKATSTRTPGSTTTQAAPRNNQGESSRGGLPLWSWPVLALAVLVALGGGLVHRRRRRGGAPAFVESAEQQEPMSTSVPSRREGE